MHKSQGDQLSAGWRQGGERGHTAVSESKLSPGVAWRDILLACGVAAAALLLYAATLLPGLGSRDTAELQWVVPTLGLAHPTGYPLYTLLGWLWCQLPLGGTPAWRLNLFSAAAAAAALAVVYALARALGQRAPAAAIAALALGVSRAFWSQATVAEVYALAALLQALLLLALLRWRDGRWPLWLACLLLGLGLAHHRSIILMLPGALLFVLMSRRAGGARPAVASRDLVLGLGGLLAGGMLYLYVPLRAPAWMQSWRQVWDHISGASLTATWLDLARLRGEGVRRIFTLARAFVWPQFLPAGALLALLGGVRLLLRDRAAAALLLLGYALTLAFCAAYYVADVEVFFIPAHVLAAPLLGEGAMALGDAARRWLGGKQWRRALGAGLAALGAGYVALLLWQNLPAVRALNSTDDERIAREVLAQPLPPGALVLGDWYSTEGPRYLQTIEGLRPDVQFGSGIGRASVIEALDHGRAVYLSAPDVELGLAQWPEGRLWRVGRAPLEAAVAASAAWADGVGLSGYTLPPGPYHPGDGVPVMLQWQALGAPSASYSFFVHLVGPDGQIWGQHDQPAPTERWQPGKRYADLVSPTLKPGAPPGRYRVTLGWYAYPSMRRLALADASADYITLGQIDVAAR